MELTNVNRDRKNRRTSNPEVVNSLVYGKIPPQSKELEEAVLGAIMLEKAAFDVVVEILKPQCFYVDAHQRIYRTMMSLADQNSPIDLLTVVEQLRKTQELDIVGGPFYVTKLTNFVVSSGLWGFRPS